MARWLEQVPLLYGIWHPYKHCLGVVYRAYYPILVLLEQTREPVDKQQLYCVRKVQYLEKLFAALLLGSAGLKPRLLRRLSELQSYDCGGMREPELSMHTTTVNVLGGLYELLHFYLPALLSIGHKVRSCTWQGHPGGDVGGETAHLVLQHCLILLAHLQQDWDANQEYTRTLACALLTWQPWHTQLPGYVFVEETCESLLGKAVKRLQTRTNVTSVERAQDLFLTMPMPRRGHHIRQGGIRRELAVVFHERLKAFIGRAHRVDQLTAPWMKKGKTFMRPGVPGDWVLATGVPEEQEVGLYQQLFRGALCCLMGSGVVSPQARAFLDEQQVNRVTELEWASRSSAFVRVQTWKRDRDARAKQDKSTGSQAVVVGSGVPRAKPAAEPEVEDPYESGPSEGATPGIESDSEDEFHGLGDMDDADGDWESLFSDSD